MPAEFDLEKLSLLVGVLIGAYTLMTALIAVITSYVMVKFRLQRLEDDRQKLEGKQEKIKEDSEKAKDELYTYIRSTLFQPDGETVLMPRSACGKEREKCQQTMQSGFKDLKKDLKAMDEKREDSKSALLGLFTKLNKTIYQLETKFDLHQQVRKVAANDQQG